MTDATLREAFDAQIELGIWAVRVPETGRWRVSTYAVNDTRFRQWCRDNTFDDPATALVEARRWYAANAT